MVRLTLLYKAITIGSILYWGRQIGLHSESSMGKWEFVAKEQGGGQ